MFDQGPHKVLRRDGVCVVVKTPPDQMPQVEYWGRDLGGELLADEAALAALDAMTLKDTPPNKPDAAWRPSLLPQGAEGWGGRPGLEAHRGGLPAFASWTAIDYASQANTKLSIEAVDEMNGLRLEIMLSLEQGGLLVVRHALTNTGADGAGAEPLIVNWLDGVMPCPRRVDTLTQFTGRWPLEKQPFVASMPVGSVTRDCRRGKTGHDSPWLFIASVGEPRWETGEIWACHLAWSGNQTYRVDNLPQHEPLIGAGELVGPAEIRLSTGERYESPEVCFSYSDCGLDGMAARFHTWLRAMPKRVDPVSNPRPFTLNTWEAVYFKQDEATLMRLADRAAQAGVERFVLDDGWFHKRRDDTRGLGDWWVDPEVWPNGLNALADHVHALGMQFGLWFEPEMVNLDSDLARVHPDWILARPSAVPNRGDLSYRSQYVLDLANPDAYAHIHDQMVACVRDLGVDYIKWDHNREVTEPVHQRDGRYGLHNQTLACYRLFDELKAEFPGLEIESCSSGGARTDAGILRHADRIWASDSNDPRDRVDIQRFTELIVPPEMIGAHVGPSPAHSTGRATEVSYRAAVSLTGCAGFEWNILECDDDEVARLAAFVALYKELRGLLHTGRILHADLADPSLRARGVVDAEGEHAVWVVASVDNIADWLAERLYVPGLDPRRDYRIRLREEVGAAKWGWITPQWLTMARQSEGFVASGRLLAEVGLQLPNLWPMQAIILEFDAQ
ncbi:alpha-galactosidase [Bifidobacterium eulemuris]|uniref:alpha-galactosidase n=1 Tax=Bifidobacterium eulemuris TaxID=1765219 RepID=A0A261GAY6_9BIFI|nr:alpha-galactosidase [Bifidobacterium eulemuris]OZG68592.1 alpha-galactosidase [Bifidobacterium eulemuris]QOL32718.1 alpha-galactosidase [Bifidobacterium eulemuris]